MKIGMERIGYGLSMLICSFLMLSLLVSCNNDDNNAGTSRVEVRLTDAPGDYEEVNVDIQDVQVNPEDDNGGDDDSGWVSLSVNKGVYDLKKLTNGIDTLLGSADLPAGKISQIRLILGPNNTVKVDGHVLPLTTPSGQQSGLKIHVKEELKDGITYKVLLDFDAARSIGARGNGDYNLKPVIRSITEALDGAIGGTVHPGGSRATVYAILGTDTASTSIDTLSGAFLVRGLQAGTYKVVVSPRAGYQSKEISGVNVTTGNVTSVGVVELSGL